MARSHPPSLLRHVRRTLEQECALKKGASIAVAVSGGPDSMALAHALFLLRNDLELKLAIISVDHGLRPEAHSELELVRSVSESWDIPFFGAQLTLQDGPNLQARAREARYGVLWSLAREHLGPEALLATAHHKDDRAETVIMRILRGTSLEGLAVLAPRSDRLLRPMIRASREDVLTHLERHELESVTDPSNTQSRFQRVRVREELLTLMKELGPGVVEHLNELADDAQRLPQPLGLNREQREQFRRALDDPGLQVDLRLPGGLRLMRGSGNKTPK